MHALIATLVPIIVIVIVALIILVLNDRFAPDPSLKKIVAYVHSTPIAREVFERYFMVIAQTFSAIYGNGLGRVGGPPVAMLLLKQVAAQNTSVQEPLNAAVQSIVTAIQQSQQAQSAPPQQAAAPPQQ